jgi:hypothetical protein
VHHIHIVFEVIAVITCVWGEVNPVGDGPGIPFSQVKPVFEGNINPVFFPACDCQQAAYRIFKKTWKFKLFNLDLNSARTLFPDQINRTCPA